MDDTHNTKKIILLDQDCKEVAPTVKKERVVIDKEHWDFGDIQYDALYQFDVLQTRDKDARCFDKMMQQVNRKINSYKQQDKTKNLFNPAVIVQNADVLSLLLQCECRCFYCRELVFVLYKNVREPKQWTLERIDNDYGHNRDNVTFACLDCNVRRRTMYHERYVFTKQLVVKKI